VTAGSQLVLLNRTAEDEWWHGYFTGRMSFVSPNRQCQSTRGSSKHSTQPGENPWPAS